MKTGCYLDIPVMLDEDLENISEAFWKVIAVQNHLQNTFTSFSTNWSFSKVAPQG